MTKDWNTADAAADVLYSPCKKDALVVAFTWADTPEGYAFWKELAKREDKQ
jgi:hypothetical protein